MPGCLAYLDDMFVIAGGRAQAEEMLAAAHRDLDRLHMTLEWAKCKALWVRDGVIQTDRDPLRAPGGNTVLVVSSIKALGIPVTQVQADRDDEFVKLACNALRSADVATLLYHQNALNIERLCVASRLTRFVQTVYITPKLLSEFDERVQQKIRQIVEARDDAEHTLIPLPISLGGLGIPSLLDIQRPALLATWYKLAAQREVVQLLRAAGLLTDDT
jgi:hypothetical protein